MGARITHENEAAVEGDVEPLVAVGRPGVCLLDSGQEITKSRTDISPEAEGAVDMHPCAMLLRQRDERLEGIEGAGVELTRLQADQGGATRLIRQQRCQAFWQDAFLRVGLELGWTIWAATVFFDVSWWTASWRVLLCKLFHFAVTLLFFGTAVLLWLLFDQSG